MGLLAGGDHDKAATCLREGFEMGLRDFVPSGCLCYRSGFPIGQGGVVWFEILLDGLGCSMRAFSFGLHTLEDVVDGFWGRRVEGRWVAFGVESVCRTY